MAPSDKAGRVVFIGNIPYGGTEEMIIDTLGRVGQVLNFRLVYDKDTGRPKGFGFAEFADADAAASAVRNLNDYEVMGRKLRVDWSNDNGAGDAAPVGYTPQPTNGQPDIPVPQPSTTLPPLPPGVELPPSFTCPDAISRTLSTLPPSQLLDILSQMKGLVMQDPAKATELLRQAPQLSYAIFQSLLILNLVDSSILGEIIDQTTAAVAASAPPPQPTPVQPQVQPQRPFPGYAPHPVPTPPVLQQQYQPPAPAPAPQMTAEDLYRAVMAMPQHQIDALPPDQRMQILAARQLMQQQQAR
jgi:cleavage stimulation factor subunit 2